MDQFGFALQTKGLMLAVRVDLVEIFNTGSQTGLETLEVLMGERGSG